MISGQTPDLPLRAPFSPSGTTCRSRRCAPARAISGIYGVGHYAPTPTEGRRRPCWTPIGPSTACPRSVLRAHRDREYRRLPKVTVPRTRPAAPNARPCAHTALYAHPLHPHAVPSTLRARPYLGRCTPRAERQTAGVQAFPSSPRTTSSLPHDLNTQHDHPHAQHFSPYGRAGVSTSRTHTASRVVPQPLGLTTPRSFARRRSQTGSSSSGGDGCAGAGCLQHNPGTARSANNANAGHATRDVRPRLYDSVDRGLRA
ncbi:hypothetical protein B0H10DRAFT_714329 [Mycena sp. CBHHK59/15]|nr:hypothetical protein B0H10DRAFT_714329 [Mycena sp. CBHHK59/15]